MFTTTVSIKGTFDIAIARNLIRTQLRAIRKIVPAMSVQTTIALTALGELIIALELDKAVPVRLQIVECNEHYCFEYSCSIPQIHAKNSSADRYQTNLEKVSHTFSLQQNNNDIQIEGSLKLNADGII